MQLEMSDVRPLFRPLNNISLLIWNVQSEELSKIIVFFIYI